MWQIYRVTEYQLSINYRHNVTTSQNAHASKWLKGIFVQILSENVTKPILLGLFMAIKILTLCKMSLFSQ